MEYVSQRNSVKWYIVYILKKELSLPGGGGGGGGGGGCKIA
jgi:hypothetical protein